MGSTLVIGFLALFALGIGQAVFRRLRNPFADCDYGTLPVAARDEIERWAPGFSPRRSRITREGDEARVEGTAFGQDLSVEARFDRQGALIELDLEAPGGMRTRERSSREALPAAAAAEIERVLGAPEPRFERTVVTSGSVGDEPHFAFKGYTQEWCWEICVSAAGRLHEVEKERKAGRRPA